MLRELASEERALEDSEKRLQNVRSLNRQLQEKINDAKLEGEKLVAETDEQRQQIQET